MTARRALYFGCIDRQGHYLQLSRGERCYFSSEMPRLIGDGFPASWAKLIDGGLLNNGRRLDTYDGKVFAVPARGPWIAFVWWDRSVDGRGASNSGFYVFGFEWAERNAAFAYAKTKWPEVVSRQAHELVLQDA